MLTKQDVLKVLTSTNKLNYKKIKQFGLSHYTPTEFYLAYYEIDKPKCDNPNCDTFGNELPFKTFTTGFSDYCNKKCANSSPKRSNKIKETNLEKYGCTTAMNSDSYMKAKKEKMLLDHDVEYFVQSEEFKEKCSQTLREKYNTDNVSKLEEVKKKKSKTCLINYGVENPSQHPDIQKKKIDTCIEKYNHIHYMGSEFQLTNWEQPVKKHINNIHNLNQKYLIDNFVVNKFFDVQSAMKYFNVSYNLFARTKTKFDLPSFVCNLGKTQTELLKYVEGILNDRSFISPLEIDVLSHEFKFGIEYNGLMFHSYGKSKYSMFNNSDKEDKQKHLNKTNLVESKGYQLFHIFENEWLDPIKKQIWISMLNSKMNKTERIYARKCEIRNVDPTFSNKFLNDNHIQGKTTAEIYIGLYHNNELVSLMTFGKSRFSKQYEYELLRFCNKLNTTVVGGFSKLIKFFEIEYKPKSLVSYANRRWSVGNVYEKNGFTFSHDSNPNFFYFKDSGRLYSRNKFQKHKLKNQLDVFDESLSESENMFNNGYRRIWDCGNKVYYKHY